MPKTEPYKTADIIEMLKGMTNAENAAGMARFGINSDNTLGVSIPEIRKIARLTGRNHDLARELWKSGIHEARILACIIDEPKKVSEKQMEDWVADFDSWDVCDQCCSNLFSYTEFAYSKVVEWSASDIEFIKRAGFALIAALAVHDKKAPDAVFEKWLPVIVKGSTDERNFVKKAVNWALRQTGKRNINLNARAIETAREIQQIDSKSARWIAADALRELASEAVQQRLIAKSKK